jgi:hypothetical protein
MEPHEQGSAIVANPNGPVAFQEARLNPDLTGISPTREA